MLLIESAAGGLLISRWNGDDARPLESIFVSTDELAALMADLLAAANGDGDAARWDNWAALAGNPALTLTHD